MLVFSDGLENKKNEKSDIAMNGISEKEIWSKERIIMSVYNKRKLLIMIFFEMFLKLYVYNA